MLYKDTYFHWDKDVFMWIDYQYFWDKICDKTGMGKLNDMSEILSMEVDNDKDRLLIYTSRNVFALSGNNPSDWKIELVSKRK